MGAASILSAQAAPSPVQSAEIDNAYSTAISDNGQWLIGQNDTDGCIFIIDLLNNKRWDYGSELTTDGSGYHPGTDKAISDDGTAIALRDGIPYYWSAGKWTKLPGNAVDGSAMMGSISADGSMIVGGYGTTGTSTEDVQFTYPCIWYRKADGTYGEPTRLPSPAKDYFGLTPQGLNAVAVSGDGKTIAATMTASNGMYEFPYVYTCDDSGQWTYKAVCLDLINPSGREVPPFPGDYKGPLQPTPPSYMTEEEFEAYRDALPAWTARQQALGLSDFAIQIESLRYAADFMTDEERNVYLPLLEAFLAVYVPWQESENAYYDFLAYLTDNGVNFDMNNTRLSPDGRYAYFAAYKVIISDPTQGEAAISNVYAPVRVDVATGESMLFSFDHNVLLSSVTADGSVFGREYKQDGNMYTMGYIFPQGNLESVDIPSYFIETGNIEAADWMEIHMDREVIKGMAPTGAYIYDYALCVGMPLATPDMSLIAFSNSAAYWRQISNDDPLYVTFLLNTGIDVDGVESITIPEGEEITGVTVYDLGGTPLLYTSSLSDVAAAGLQKGIYIIKAATAGGNLITNKIIL